MVTHNDRVIIVGGGLAGLAAAWSAIEAGAQVLLLEAAGAICGSGRAETSRLVASGELSCDASSDPTAKSLSTAVWLAALSRECESDGQRKPAPVRAASSLAAALESKADQVEVICRARVVRLTTSPDGSCIGCCFTKNGIEVMASGSVVLCCGGFGADFSEGSFLASFRPDLLHLATTSGEFSTGVGLKMALDLGAHAMDMGIVEVLPTALVPFGESTAKLALPAARMLREAGGILLNEAGERFCDELASDDHIAAEMLWSQDHFRLVLDSAAAEKSAWLCQLYARRGLMRKFPNCSALAVDMGVSPQNLTAAFADRKRQRPGFVRADTDLFSLDGCSPSSSSATPVRRNRSLEASAITNEQVWVASVRPAVHCCCGGLSVKDNGSVIGVVGLFAAGEIIANHNQGRGHCWLEDCVNSGHRAGSAAARRTLSSPTEEKSEDGDFHNSNGHMTNGSTSCEASLTQFSPKSVAEKRALWQILESTLTAGVLERVLAEKHSSSGDVIRDAAEELAAILLAGASAAADIRPSLSISVRDRSSFGVLPTPRGRICLPEVSQTSAEVLLSCVHCRLPLTVQVASSPECVAGLEDKDSGDTPRGPVAYATLLYGHKAEYFLGALVLGWALKNNSTNDRLLLHTEDVLLPFLEALQRFWILRKVDYLHGHESMFANFESSRFQNVFTKLQALSCIEYSKVLMLDLDMLVRGSLDELFELRAPAALKRCSGLEQPPHGGLYAAEDIWKQNRDEMFSGINAGVMLFEPDMTVFARMKAEIEDPCHPEHTGCYGPEQEYLARFYTTFVTGHWTHIHAKFNYQLMLPEDYVSSAHRNLDVVNDVVVAHYSGPRVKPWKIDGDVNADAVERLLTDDTIRNRIGRSSGRGPARASSRRERTMDNVTIVEDSSTSSITPAAQELMWEWVLALRKCVAELEQDGVDILTLMRST